MGVKILKHHEEQLDATRGAYRVTLQAKKSSFGPDDHPQSWDVGVIVSCPSCGCQFGVGFDANGPKIGLDGKTDRVVKCMNPKGCAWSDVMEFDLFDDAATKAEVGKRKADAAAEIADTRIRVLKEHHRRQLELELDERALAEAKKIVPDGDPDAARKFADFMKAAKKLG